MAAIKLGGFFLVVAIYFNVLMRTNYHENYRALVVETVLAATPVALAEEVGESQA